MKEAGVAGRIKRFADLPDPRVEGRTDHDLLDIVVLALCAVKGRVIAIDGKALRGSHAPGAVCGPFIRCRSMQPSTA